MDRRLRKQLIYAISFFALLALVIGGFYFRYLKPAPSCFDGVQNQNEEGVDCGGPCIACFLRTIKPLTLADRILVLHPDASHASFLTQISNPNFDYAAKSFSYSFELLDAKGGVVQTFSGNSFIYGGEVKYILVPNLPLPSAKYVDVDLKTSGENWVPASEFAGPPQFNTAGAQTNISPDKVTVDGNIIDMDAAAFSRVTVVAIFRGTRNEVAGASQTEVKNLTPSVPQPFSVIHPFMQNVDPLGTKIFTYAARD